MTKKKTQSKVGPCHFCKKPVDDSYYCHGCRVRVCDACDTNIDRGWGQHTPEDHRLDEEGFQ